ncbi:MAG: NAD(P)/FAD-dependent oxidoreductase [Candidatus Ranarchaeia archaeon]
MNVIIIGSGAAALSAAQSAQMINPKANVILISEEEVHPYRKPAIVKLIQGIVEDPEEIAHGYLETKKSKLQFKDKFNPNAIENIKVNLNSRVDRVDPEKKMVYFTSLDTGKSNSLTYSNLVLATGACAFTPPVEGNHLEGCFSCWTAKQALEISEYAKNVKNAVVVGAGFTGLETAENLVRRGIKTIVAVRSRLLRTLVEPDISVILTERIHKEGINVICNARELEVLGNKKVEGFKINGKTYPAELVVFATGARPNVDLIKDFNPEMNGRALKLNKELSTSIPNIYAAGNVGDYHDFILNKRFFLPVARLASYQGRIAGMNAAGGKARDIGFMKAQIDQITGIQVAAVGHNLDSLNSANIEAKVEDWSDRFVDFEGEKPIVKVIIGPENKIYGAQVLRTQFAGVIATHFFQAMKKRVNADEIILPKNTGPMSSSILIKEKRFYDIVKKNHMF